MYGGAEPNLLQKPEWYQHYALYRFSIGKLSLSPNAILTESDPISIEQVERQSFGVLDHSDLLVASNLYHPGKWV